MASCDNTKPRIKGRKWATQRLPKSMVLAIRQVAERRGLSPADCIAVAFETSRLAADFDRALHPWKGLVTLCREYRGYTQPDLPLDGDADK